MAGSPLKIFLNLVIPNFIQCFTENSIGMFIKKLTNRKEGRTHTTYRLVKSKRVDCIPQHICMLDLESLNDLAEYKP